MDLSNYKDVTLEGLFKLGLKMQRIKGADKHYSIVITGDKAGQVLFLEDGKYFDVTTKSNEKSEEKEKKVTRKSILSGGVLFGGQWYQESLDIPSSPEELFKFELAEDKSGYVITGFTENLGNNKPTSVSLPNSYKGIDIIAVADSAFKNEHIVDLHIPGNITEIRNEAFRNNSLKKLIIEEGIEHIKDYAFIDNNLDNIVLPRTLKVVRKWAFANNNIEKMSILSKDTKFGGSVFAHNGIYKNSQSFQEGPHVGEWNLTNNRWVLAQ